jgi:clan AA aspartic protease (TIGR02281 family)
MLCKLAVRVLFVILTGPSWAGTVYKCKSPEGGMLYQEAPCTGEAQAVSSWPSKTGPKTEEGGEASTSQDVALVIGQGRNGGYLVDGAINDHYVNFVIDTGASFVTLPQRVATSAGIHCEKKLLLQTGNGATMACTATIRELKFGSFTVRNVDAVIAPNLVQPLLGMNVLRRFRVEQEGGEMRLSKKY